MRNGNAPAAGEQPMGQAEFWTAAAQAIEQLAYVRSLPDVVVTLRDYTRHLLRAEGIAVILRDGDFCHYVAEDAVSPLWAGQRFPAESCVSGWAMRNRQTVSIADVFLDDRVPHDAYRSTFVRSMLMVPIGGNEPVAAVGGYWARPGIPGAREIAVLEALARAASTALENGRLLTSLERLNAELEQRVLDRTAELEQAQENLRQTQKMEVVGQLSGNVAHDFNNLLAPIMSTLDLVLGGNAPSALMSRSAAVAMDAAEKAKLLVQRLLAFARRQPLVPVRVDLAALVEEVRDLIASTLGSTISLDLHLAPGLPSVRADPQQLELAILNLVVNARDAMPSGGNLEITVDLAGGTRPASLEPGEYIRLAVRDNGVGMSEKTRIAAKEPFFTTKTAGHGIGLGLSMVDGLVGQLGGALEIQSTPQAGTEICMWFPAIEQPAQRAGNDSSSEPVVSDANGGGAVLLVDDEVLVRMGTSTMLENLGYTVTEAEDAQQAMGLIERGLKPDIVITDHIMPGMTGAEFALRLRTDYPAIPVMIISGYQGIDLIAPDIVRLSKPFRQVHLTASMDAARAQVQPFG